MAFFSISGMHCVVLLFALFHSCIFFASHWLFWFCREFFCDYLWHYWLLGRNLSLSLSLSLSNTRTFSLSVRERERACACVWQKWKCQSSYLLKAKITFPDHFLVLTIDGLITDLIKIHMSQKSEQWISFRYNNNNNNNNNKNQEEVILWKFKVSYNFISLMCLWSGRVYFTASAIGEIPRCACALLSCEFLENVMFAKKCDDASTCIDNLLPRTL